MWTQADGDELLWQTDKYTYNAFQILPTRAKTAQDLEGVFFLSLIIGYRKEMWSRLPARRSMGHWRGQLSQIRPCSFQSCSMQHGINARTQRDFSPTGSDYRGAFISDHSYQFTCVCLLLILRIADVPLVSKHWIWRHISSFFLFFF